MSERLCVFCVHWRFEGGSPFYSALTPGEDSSMECARGVWEATRFVKIYSEDRFRQIILAARDCSFYQSVGGKIG